MGGMARADMRPAVGAEGDIQDPVMDVSDAAVVSCRLQEGRGLGGQAGNENADVGRDPVPAATFGLDPDQAGLTAPLAVRVLHGREGRGRLSPGSGGSRWSLYL